MKQFDKAAASTKVPPELERDHDSIIARLIAIAVKEEQVKPKYSEHDTKRTLAYAIMLKAHPDDLELLTKFTSSLGTVGFETEDVEPTVQNPSMHQHCEALFRHAIEANPKSIMLRYGLALSLCYQKKLGQAEDVMKEGMALRNLKEAGWGQPAQHWKSAFEDVEYYVREGREEEIAALTERAPSP